MNIKILFLAANPLDIDRLRLDEEMRAIDTALRQADNFALSTDSSWVILDDHRVGAAARNVDRFKEVGIGLAAVDPSGQLTVLARPRRRRPVRWLRSLMAERAWAAASQTHPTPQTRARQVSRKPASTR